MQQDGISGALKL